MGIPETLDEVLSAPWLTEALGRRYPGTRVRSVTPGPVVSRVSTNARFEIECEGGQPEGLPRNLCVKGYFGEGSAAGPAGVPEALFYRDLAGPFGVPTLECFYAEIDPASRHGLVITEDVAASGATFLDALSPYSPAQLAASLELYATLHGRTWQDDRLRGADWLDPRLARTLRARGLAEIEYNFGGPIGAGVPGPARDAARLIAVVSALARMEAAAEPWCLLHGDAHIGNLFLDRTGRPLLVDWQLVQRGSWYIDVGYHLGCALGVEDRRRSEDSLVARYMDRLSDAGGKVPSGDGIRTGICAGLVYGFFLWAITVKVKPAITTEMLRRLGTAVADHDALSVTERATAGFAP